MTEPRRRWRRLGLVVTICVLVAALRSRGCDHGPTVGSFNIEYFPHAQTDPERVARRIAELDAGVFAVQEITDRAAFEQVLALASRQTGRDYRLVLSRCIDARPRPQLTTGIVYDVKRVKLVATRDFPELRRDGRGECGRGVQPGVLGVFEDLRGRRLAVLSVHFKPFPRNRRIRVAELTRALTIADDARKTYGARTVVLGDMNTTDDDEPRDFGERARARGYDIITADLPCTEYWRPPNERTFVPSLLDHAIMSDTPWTDVEVLGMCRELRCEQVAPERMHDDYVRVSDHCPIRLRGAW